MGESVNIHPSADVDAGATVHATAKIWHLAQVREDAVIGAHCIIGRGAYVGSGVVVGDNCKLQNYALIYEPAVLAEGVFVGPGSVLTNDHHPRAVSPGGMAKSSAEWEVVGVVCETGVSIGAGAICVAPVRLGQWSMIGAGAVVTRDVPAFGLVAGSPARRIGWVGRSGRRLEPAGAGRWTCPDSGERYRERGNVLELESEGQR